MNNLKRILFVGMVDSVHTARWISQIADHGWDIFLYPVERARPSSTLPGINIFNPYLPPFRTFKGKFRSLPWFSPYFLAEAILAKVLKQPVVNLRAEALATVIQFYKPDLIHSLEMQHAGYLTLTARERLKDKFPKWAMTIWGSDLYLFARFKDHKPRVRSILETCDFFGSESERDIRLARELGFKGKTLPVLPATGGFDLDHCGKLKQLGPVSDRRTIVLKGYQHFAGRALVGLRALALCADLLKGYRLSIFGASPDVLLAAELFSQDTRIPVDIVSGDAHDAHEDDIFKAFGQARIAVGLSISDGLPRSLLEAIVMGAYPIQSNTSCANEWIENGKNGTLVPPEDPEVIADAIRIALTKDAVVNNAAEMNFRIARDRLDAAVITPIVVKMYDDMLKETR